MAKQFLGSFKGYLFETLIFPLEVIKIRQQCMENSLSSLKVAKRLLHEEGHTAFYRGLYPQLVKTALKQVWCWPMITGMPCFLQTYGIKDTHQQIVTGLAIATVDTLITTPLERAKILSALTGKIRFSLSHVYKNGWQGCRAYFAKRSINMITFLTALGLFQK